MPVNLNKTSTTLVDMPTDINLASGKVVKVNGTQVLTSQQLAIVDVVAGSGTDIDTTARTAINDILSALRAHGLIAT